MTNPPARFATKPGAIVFPFRNHMLTIAVVCLLQAPAGAVELFEVGDVKLLPGPFFNAQQLDRRYLLAHDPDRLLAPYRNEAGLEPKGEIYPNWESTGLGGQTAGHYLTAISNLVAATGDPQLRLRLDYLVADLALCQQAHGDGYLGGVPDSDELWREVADGEIQAEPFSLNGRWVPWYNLHKLFAGLRDAWLVGGNRQARGVLLGLADWCAALVDDLTDRQMQEMLRAEHGGMNEVLADIHAATGDEKYLDLAHRFSHEEILDPLLAEEDRLTGLHANTQIPKVIGYARIGQLAGNQDWIDAARFFWQTVVEHRSVAIGGNSVREHFNPTDDFSSLVESNQGPETCNTYNMLRLTERLFQFDPAPRYVEFYERALYNHILASQHPQHGGFVYLTPLRPRHYRVYSQPEQCFWCCVGSGMENHTRYGRFIYARGDSELYVNLFIPSVVQWNDQSLTLRQETRFPDQPGTRLSLSLAEPRELALKVRRPSWAGEGFSIEVNGRAWDDSGEPGAYVSIRRRWQDGDHVEIRLPMRTKLERLPDGADYAALLHGPIVLAAETGRQDLAGLVADDSRMGHITKGPFRPLDQAPMLVGSDAEILAAVEPVAAEPLTFTAAAAIRPDSYAHLQLFPFFRLHDARYMIYWRTVLPDEYAEVVAGIERDERRRLALEARTIDRVQPGEQQPEVEHNFQGGQSSTGTHRGRRFRDARDWFSYEFNVPADQPLELQATYFAGDRGRRFDVLANDRVIGTFDLPDAGGDFVDVTYPIPAEVVSGARDGVLTVKFEAHEGSIAGGVYGLRVLQQDD